MPNRAEFTVHKGFPARIKPGEPQLLWIYSPFMLEFNVTLNVTASIPGVLPTNPFTLRWPNNDNKPKSVLVSMPVGATGFTLSFFTNDNPRFMAPPDVSVSLWTYPLLLAEAAKHVPVTPSQYPSQSTFVPSPYVAGRGTARFKDQQRANLNSLADTGSSAIINPKLIVQGTGFTFSGQCAEQRACAVALRSSCPL